MAAVSDLNNVYSGNYQVDALLEQQLAANWNYLLPSRTTLYYTFDCSSGSVIDQETSETLTAFNSAQIAATASILSYAASLTGISFAETPSGTSADLHFGAINIPEATISGLTSRKFSYSASGELLTAYTAEAFVYLDNVEFANSNDSPTAGSAGYEALLHEIGHVLGLGHPFGGLYPLPSAEDNTNNTVMSYTRAGNSKSTFQSYDLLALTWIYGTDGLGGRYGYNSSQGPSLTPDTTAPTVFSFRPTDGATGVATSSNIVLSFSEPIARGTGIILLQTAAGATIETFDPATSNRLTISGSTLTIDPTSTLANDTDYYLTLSAGTIKDLAGNSYVGTSTYDFTTAAAPASAYTVPGTLGNDFFIPSAGNNYLGGGGNDTYVISSNTLSGSVTAQITDTEGSNVIQLVDGMTISASSFYGNAAQLTLASGAIVQILGASALGYQVGANAPSGDTAATQTYSQFTTALGGSVPLGSTPVPGTAGYVVPSGFTQAPALTPAVAGPSYTVPGTLGNDFFTPSAGNNYLGGGGNDTYVISPMTLSGAVTAKITDTEGVNVIQWVDGMTVTASSFYNDAAQLTLSTGAKVQILGASKFNFQLGANAPAGDTATSQTYAQFANTLGVTLPADGAAPVSGTPNFVVPSSGSAFTVVDLSSGTVTAAAAAEEFRYDFQIVGGRITKAGDGEVTINGFDVVKDKLVFVNTTNHTVYTEAEFKAPPGVVIADDPFGNNTSIYLDPASGASGGVTLTGISDASLSLIMVETR